MQKQFVFDTSFGEIPRYFTRSKANGYKELFIDSSVDVASVIDVKAEGEALHIVESSEEPSEMCEYVILCRQFGLFGGKELKSHISVVLLDGGWMLVTLKEGSIGTKLDGKLVAATTFGFDCGQIRMVSDAVKWVDETNIKSVAQYFGDKSNFLYDFELSFVVYGESAKGCDNFSFSHKKDEDIDLSLGYFAIWQQMEDEKETARQVKAEARQVQAVVTKLFNQKNQSIDDDWDDDEDDSDYDDDDEDAY